MSSDETKFCDGTKLVRTVKTRAEYETLQEDLMKQCAGNKVSGNSTQIDIKQCEW